MSCPTDTLADALAPSCTVVSWSKGHSPSSCHKEGNFSKLVASFGAAQESEEDESDVIAEKEDAKIAAKKLSRKMMGKAAGTGKLEVGHSV